MSAPCSDSEGANGYFQCGYKLQKLDVTSTSRVQFVLKSDVQNGDQSRITRIICPLAVLARRGPVVTLSQTLLLALLLSLQVPGVPLRLELCDTKVCAPRNPEPSLNHIRRH